MEMIICFVTHSVESVVQEYDLSLPSLSCSHQHIPWVGVTVDEPTQKDHLAVHPAQLQSNLYVQGGGRQDKERARTL